MLVAATVIKLPEIDDDSADLAAPEGLASFTPRDLASPSKKVRDGFVFSPIICQSEDANCFLL